MKISYRITLRTLTYQYAELDVIATCVDADGYATELELEGGGRQLLYEGDTLTLETPSVEVRHEDQAV